jgi:uncharacterized damage-inducible protein DinB
VADHYEQLMRHHAWAVQRLLDTAALLSPDQLETPSASHGTLLATLRHVADVDQSWGRVARGAEPDDIADIEERLDSLEALRAYWLTETAALVEFASTLTASDLEREIRPPWKRHPYLLWQVLTHLTNHRAEHGNEIGWRLTALGHSPGELAFMGWVDLQRAAEA